MASYSDILFGRIVLKNRLVPQAQVEACLRQKGPGQSLGEALVERGLLSRSQARKVQRAQALMQFLRAEKAFARILYEQRLVDLATLQRCFRRQEQERYRVRIGQLLLQEGRLSPEQLEQVVDRQLVVLAEDTGRIEEEGLLGAGASEEQEQGQADEAVERLSGLREAEDLESSRMKSAVGPRGLFDAPSREAIRRTLPFRPAASLGAEEGPPASGEKDELVGTTIASRYRILAKVGEGGMGTVYKAEHCLMEKIVALKVLHPALVSNRGSLDRFRQEIRAASRFQHKNVVQIYDAGEGEGGIFYMAMEFAAGDTLEEVIRREGALTIDRALAYFRQTLRAVAEAHKKRIIHRDLKSGNLILTRGKDGLPLVKVMDFGIAKIAFDEQEALGAGPGLYRTQEGIVTGTPQYMSPEQASGERVDHRSDLYSLGVILFEMLTGELPFRSDTPMGYLGKHIVEPPPRPSSLRPDLPPVLDEVVLRLLEKSPDDRYQSADQVLADLDVRCSGESLLASGGPASSRRRPALTVAVEPPQDVGAVDASAGTVPPSSRTPGSTAGFGAATPRPTVVAPPPP
ncbi:MAG: serine/threonine protein kinase, partial [Planctomycetota bacterium]